MEEAQATNWQQRYSASEVYTIRVKLLDKPGTFAKLSSAIGMVGANIGNINFVDVQEEYKIRDVTLYVNEEKQLENLLNIVKGLDGVEIIKVIDEVLEIHRRGTIKIISRVPLKTITDLRMVYTPGVAEACKEIQKNPEAMWEMTGICDRVAIVTDGTAVLGLGDIGVKASLPVMEGKAAIFAEFAQISAFPVLVDSKDPDTIVETVMRIAPGFGAIQLEDIAAPACFEIEEKLISKLDMPVFHDDQHGTATVVLAGLINALKHTKKKKENCSVLILGAGAAGIAITYMLLEFGIGDVVLYDSKGAVFRGRKGGMNPYKDRIAQVTNKNNQQGTLAECFAGKDIFIGVSRPKMVTKEMISAMNKNPIVFPLSNPVGEITKEEAIEAGAAIAADGRDINNALAYPGIFRGALDARAKKINLSMKLAAAERIAQLAASSELLPDMLDRTVHTKVAKAVMDAWEKTKNQNR